MSLGIFVLLGRDECVRCGLSPSMIAVSRGSAWQTRLDGSRSCFWWRLLETQGTLCQIRVTIFRTRSMQPSPNYFDHLLLFFVRLAKWHCAASRLSAKLLVPGDWGEWVSRGLTSHSTLYRSIGEAFIRCAILSFAKTKVFAIQPRHQGGAHGGRAPAKITGLIMFYLGCQIKILVFWGNFIFFGINNKCVSSFMIRFQWLMVILDRFLWCHLKCIVWVLSLFLGSIDARTWRGYRLYGPRLGPTDNFSLVTWPSL